MLRAEKRISPPWACVGVDPIPSAPRMGSLTEKSRDRRSRKVACAGASPANGGRHAPPRKKGRRVNLFRHATEATGSETEESKPAFTTSGHPSVSSTRANAKELTVSARRAAAVSPRAGQVTRSYDARVGTLLRTSLLAALFWQFCVHSQDFECLEKAALSFVVFYIREQVVLFTRAADVRQHGTSVKEYTSISEDMPPDGAVADLKARRRNVPSAHAAKDTPKDALELGRDESNIEDRKLEQEVQNSQTAQSTSYYGVLFEEHRPTSPWGRVIAFRWQELLRKQMSPYLAGLSAGTEPRATTTVEAFPAPARDGPFRATSTTFSSSSRQEQTVSTSQEKATPCTSLACTLSSTRRTNKKRRLLRSHQARQRAVMIFTTCAVISALASALVAKYATELHKRYKGASKKGRELRTHIENRVLSLLSRSARARMMVLTVIAGLAGHSLLRQLTVLLIVFCFLGALLGVLVMYGSQAIVHSIVDR